MNCLSLLNGSGLYVLLCICLAIFTLVFMFAYMANITAVFSFMRWYSLEAEFADIPRAIYSVDGFPYAPTPRPLSVCSCVRQNADSATEPPSGDGSYDHQNVSSRNLVPGIRYRFLHRDRQSCKQTFRGSIRKLNPRRQPGRKSQQT